MDNTKKILDKVTNQLIADEKRWFALYTKYKCEKFVTTALSRKGIVAYLPLVNKTKRYTRKVKHYEIPLINCYVFVHIDMAQYVPTLETEYVMKFLKQGKDLLAIPDAEIHLLKRIAGDEVEVFESEFYNFVQGEEVEVVSGHLTGMKGKIVARGGKSNFVVDLNTIGFQLRIKIDLALLRSIKLEQSA